MGDAATVTGLMHHIMTVRCNPTAYCYSKTLSEQSARVWKKPAESRAWNEKKQKCAIAAPIRSAKKRQSAFFVN